MKPQRLLPSSAAPVEQPSTGSPSMATGRRKSIPKTTQVSSNHGHALMHACALRTFLSQMRRRPLVSAGNLMSSTKLLHPAHNPARKSTTQVAPSNRYAVSELECGGMDTSLWLVEAGNGINEHNVWFNL